MRKEITKLRSAMKKHGIDAYIVPTGDFHGSEYIHDYFKSRAFLSGFTGSAGTLVVTHSDALLWTDGRYFLQGEMQLKGSGITLMKDGLPNVPSIADFLSSLLGKGQTLGFDGKVMPYAAGLLYETISLKSGFNIDYSLDLLSEIWEDRPALTASPLWELPLEYAGKIFDQKLSEIRSFIKEKNATHLLLCSLEENAWLYNLRGSDVLYTPVFLGFTMISEKSVTLYAFESAFENVSLPEGVTLKPYMTENRLTVSDDILALSKDAVIALDPASCSYSIWQSAETKTAVPCDSPASLLKSVKNDSEIRATEKAHIDDGAAVLKFIYWLKNTIGKMPLTEISASDYLKSKRSEISDFVELSFDTISGYAQNGAIIHYSASEDSNAQLMPSGFLLVDSGGQYMRGTTDITRTIALGPLTDKMKKCYTAVLKSNIDLAMQVFDSQTPASDLDKIARKAVNDIGYDYNHGTGHGVGHVLCVHEGPNTINKRNNKPTISPSTITTDEPGIYIEGEFGIRLENELLCETCIDNPDKYCFRPLTLCPFERSAIIKEMLTDEELDYLNSYHRKVYETLSPLLNEKEKEFLRAETMPL